MNLENFISPTGEDLDDAVLERIAQEFDLHVLEAEGHPFHGNQWTGGFAPVPDVLYRGTGPGSFDQTSRDFAGGELGGGIYMTADKEVADGYSEGPGHVTHTVEWVRRPTPAETGYLAGGNEDLSNDERLYNGLGHELWRGTTTHENFRQHRADLKKAALDAGLKVIIGMHNVSGAGQIAVLDRSLIRVVTPRTLEAEGHPFHGNQWTKGQFPTEEYGVRPTTLERVHESLLTVEPLLRERAQREKVERAYGYDREGAVRWTAKGKELQVKHSKRDTDAVRGGTVVHSHVSDTSFSGRDLKNAHDWNLHESRVVVPSGTFVLGPPRDGWSSLPPTFDATVDREFHSITGYANENVERIVNEFDLHYRFEPTSPRHLEAEGHPFHGNQYTDQYTGLRNRVDRDLSRRARINDTARSLGFPPEKIRDEPITRRFDVGGKNFKEGAHYDPEDGTITLGSQLRDRDLDQVLAHEIEHHRFHQVLQHVPVYGGPDVGVDPNLPTVEKFWRAYHEHGEELAAQDGVTDYSSAYWREVKKLEAADEINDDAYEQAFKRATNETLAEIASLQANAQSTAYLKIAPVWNDLYTALDQAYAEVKAKTVVRRKM